jgi:hypothetical protein
MTQRLFLQGLVAGAFGTLLGGAALLYTLARLELAAMGIHQPRFVHPGICRAAAGLFHHARAITPLPG